jgi:hypothetical protein
MAGSEADSDREIEEKAATADSSTLARFLTPVPRARSSWPAAPKTPVESDVREEPTPRAEDGARASLFSERPIPRRDSSLLPPPADAAPTPSPGAFGEQESPTGSLSVEKAVRSEPDDEEDEDDDDDEDRDSDELDVVPGAGLSFGAPAIRRAAILFGAAAIAVVVVLTVRRVAAPSKGTPSAAASHELAHPADPREGTGETLDPTDDSDREPQGADPAMGRELRREARRLLEGGKAEEGVALARRAIQADPDPPEAYILLAAGLQDLGRWQESRDVFAKCVRDTNGKANAECVYFATGGATPAPSTKRGK